ncbi:MAG: TolC family protein [Acidobacteriota bacterium]
MREAQSRLELARLERQQTQLRVQREVRTAAANLASARVRVEALRNSVAESERILRDERLKFEAGRSVIHFVPDAESALLTNQSLLAQARRSVLIAELALELSTGRLDAGKIPGQ